MLPQISEQEQEKKNFLKIIDQQQQQQGNYIFKQLEKTTSN